MQYDLEHKYVSLVNKYSHNHLLLILHFCCSNVILLYLNGQCLIFITESVPLSLRPLLAAYVVEIMFLTGKQVRYRALI